MLAHLFERQRAARQRQPEVDHPHRRPVGGLDLVGVLEEHAHAEALEHRQAV